MTRYKHLVFPPFCSMLVKQASYAWSGGHSWINSGFLWIRCQQKIASKVWEASYHNKFICKLLLTSQSWAHESKGNTDNSHALAFNARCFFFKILINLVQTWRQFLCFLAFPSHSDLQSAKLLQFPMKHFSGLSSLILLQKNPGKERH